MSDKTTIEWTNSTWNPVTGCTKVSPGCDNCYAETFAERFRGTPGHHFENGFDVQLRPNKLYQPLHWRKGRRIFVNSMSDLFHKAVTDEYITQVFAVMALTPQHTYQILSKRPARMRALLNDPDFWYRVGRFARHIGYDYDQAANYLADGRNIYDTTVWEQLRFLPNTWIGASVEDQKRADLRVPALLETPAAVRFISAEPLLGPVDLSRWLGVEYMDSFDNYGPELFATLADKVGPAGGLGWVIVGGESGHGARPMHPAWARSLRDQCEAADVPFLFKQWGEWGPAPWSVRIPEPAGGWKAADPTWLAAEKAGAERLGATHDIRPSGHLYKPNHKPWSLERDPDGDYPGAIRRWGKKRAGRELDGRTWDQFPKAVTL